MNLTTTHILCKGLLMMAIAMICFSYHGGNPVVPVVKVKEIYHRADSLFNLSDPTDKTDSMAMAGFERVIEELERLRALNDTTLFLAWMRKGNLLDEKQEHVTAIQAYHRAVAYKAINNQWNDSLLYEVHIYIGTDYYHLNNFDSATHYLLQAEALSKRYPRMANQDRLYNALGALYYENGNYLQSRNYFVRALELITANEPNDMLSAANFKNNIAAANDKLGFYRQSLSIYAKLLTNKRTRSATLLNMGKAYASLLDYRQALQYFYRVNYLQQPRVLNEMARTHLALHQPDSAIWYLNRFMQWARQKNSPHNTVDDGVNHLLRGQVLVMKQQYEAALTSLQRSIVAFSSGFNNHDIFTNPAGFTGDFTSYTLYYALFNKASAFEQLYQQHKTARYLQASLAAYQSAISLLRYIEKSYDTDDAKLFLKTNSQQAYQRAFLVGLDLHKLYPQQGYLEQAFITGEKSKASVMYAGLSERSFKNIPGIDAALIHKERNIKYNLARLTIQIDQTQDSTKLDSIAKLKSRYEIDLSRVQKQLEQNSLYYQQKYSDSYPGVQQIRQQLQNEQAVLSFYTTPGQLHLFVITRDDFKYVSIDSFANLQNTISQWVSALRSTGSGKRFKGEPWGADLYRNLVQPMQTVAGDKEQWIIIPDNILYYLPFESLPAAKNLLLHQHEISYQFSARFVAGDHKSILGNYSVLAFAPFVQQGLQFPRLPASLNEILNLPGKRYTGQMATKQQFLAHFNRYPIVHLATHAMADSANSGASFIAFYPGTRIAAEDALYLEELYSLNMDATQLLIISACETGNGQLVQSEGVLSLTRGFAYAGCKSIVNSLWKADDEATSAILQQFHIYLQRGYTKSKALRQAKLDYLASDALYKSPGYWAHLILIGDTTPVVDTSSGMRWWLIGAAGLTVVLVGWFFKRKKSRRGS